MPELAYIMARDDPPQHQLLKNDKQCFRCWLLVPFRSNDERFPLFYQRGILPIILRHVDVPL
jgi:hypothetical protein